MAIQHMVWIRFHPEVSPQRIQAHLTALASLKTKVPEVQALYVGENFTDRANGFTHGLLVQLPTRAALDHYQAHPEHVAVAAPLKAEADLMAMDIETPE